MHIHFLLFFEWDDQFGTLNGDGDHFAQSSAMEGQYSITNFRELLTGERAIVTGDVSWEGGWWSPQS